MGCNTCAVACKAENNLPTDVWWNRVLTEGGASPNTCGGTYEAPTKTYIPLACQHCANPACTKVCPVVATWKDEETGIVRQDYDKCIGCRMCIAACPYTGVRSFNWEEPQWSISVPTGAANIPSHQKHVVEKCNFCAHRLARGEKPSCMILCPGRARFWGDLDDPASEVSRLVANREHKQLMSEYGTNPSVYYLV